MTESTQTRSNRPDYRVSAILPRSNGKAFFAEIGAAWSNSDGSINVKLELVPTDGSVTLHLRSNDESTSDSKASTA